MVRPEHLVISIAAGRRIEHIETKLPEAKVVRVMPNLAALISEGMSVFCTGDRVTVEDRKKVITLLSCFGQVLELPEEQFDAVTAVSGSGPAFFAHLLELMVEGGEELGLDRVGGQQDFGKLTDFHATHAPAHHGCAKEIPRQARDDYSPTMGARMRSLVKLGMTIS